MAQSTGWLFFIAGSHFGMCFIAFKTTSLRYGSGLDLMVISSTVPSARTMNRHTTVPDIFPEQFFRKYEILVHPLHVAFLSSEHETVRLRDRNVEDWI